MRPVVTGIVSVLILVFSLGCSTTPEGGDEARKLEKIERENSIFLEGKDREGETFRVLFSSERYETVQLAYKGYIEREEDEGGDRYMQTELHRYDKINEANEGVLRVWLYPESGRIMKIRPVKILYLTDIQQLITEDIQRWSFKFPKNAVVPTRFDVRYRVILSKKLSDEEIMKEVREQIQND